MDVYVLGLHLHEGAAVLRDLRLEELAFRTVRAALERAGVRRQDLDSVTLAASDELDGRAITSMLLAAPAGAYLKDEIRVTDSGLTGLALAALRLETGRFDLGLVASWNMTSVGPLEEAMRMRAEPFFLRPVGINRAIADGLAASVFAQRADPGAAIAAADARVAERRRQAALNPRRVAAPPVADRPVVWPLSERHRAPVTDGCVALVLASGRWCARNPQARPLARLRALAWNIDSYRLDGERLGGLAGFRHGLADLRRRAGLAEHQRLDVAELDAQDAFQDVQMTAALAGCAGAVSPSGGAWAQNPYFCNGLRNAAEAVLQVADQAGPTQVAGAASALAHGAHGYAQQGHTFALFERI